MHIRNLAIFVVCFIASLIVFAYRFESPTKEIILSFGFGLAVGSSLVAISIACANVASVWMERRMAAKLLSESPWIMASHPTREVGLHVYKGPVDSVIPASAKHKTGGNVGK